MSFLVNRMTEIKDVLGELYPEIADFLADPTKIDSILADMQEQAAVILGG